MDKKHLFLVFFIVVGFALILVLIISSLHIWDYIVSRYWEKQVWVATEKVLMADGPYFLPATGTIEIEKGEKCVPIKDVDDKVVIYTEILCEKAGAGWVDGRYPFKVIRSK